MKAVEYLRQLETLESRIKTEQRAYQKKFDLATRVTSSLKDILVQTSKTGNSTEKTIIEMIAAEERLDEVGAEYLRTMDQVMDMIAKVPNPKHQRVLTYRYIDRLKFTSIAALMYNSTPSEYGFESKERYIYKLHNRALDELQKVLDEEGH